MLLGSGGQTANTAGMKFDVSDLTQVLCLVSRAEICTLEFIGTGWLSGARVKEGQAKRVIYDEHFIQGVAMKGSSL